MPNRFNMHILPLVRRPLLGLKRLFPSNLFGRAFLILVLPMVLSQLLIAHIFYDRHWGSVSRNMANSVVGDVVWLYETYQEEFESAGHIAALHRTNALGRQLGITVTYENGRNTLRSDNKQFPALYRGLAQRFAQPITIHLDDTHQVHVRISEGTGTLDMSMTSKMLTSPTTLVFMLWMVGSSLLLMIVATLFLRNQVRPIVQLAHAAERLGLGHDVTNFKPRGASEVRRAGRAFLVMSERIHRHVQNRTEMLAGISHDLRTPLTRMCLELELAQMSDAARSALTTDIDEMGTMIDEYLSFAGGDAGEIPETTDLSTLIADSVHGYTRSQRAVHYEGAPTVELMLRPQAIRRALTNLIDNALRYGGNVAYVALEPSTTFVRVKISDRGPGIDRAQQEEVFKPFTRLEPSRNSETGGVGLGLSIARTVAQRHGGDITLENLRDATGAIIGLEVTMRLPRAVQPRSQ